MRTVSIAMAALAVLVLGIALSSCGSPGTSAAGGHPPAASSSVSSAVPVRSSTPSPPAAAPPDIALVRLGTGFSPGSLRLSVGQQFLLTVSPGVQAQGLDARCGSAGGTAAGGLLSVRCAQGGYLYTAEHPGTGIISAAVGPHCAPGKTCPQWRAEAQLRVAIT